MPINRVSVALSFEKTKYWRSTRRDLVLSRLGLMVSRAMVRTSVAKLLIAQLVEHLTVDVKRMLSSCRWFDSGCGDFLFALICSAVTLFYSPQN